VRYGCGCDLERRSLEDHRCSASRCAVLDPGLDERASVVTFCEQGVVGLAKQNQVVGVGRSAASERYDVVELQPTASLAALSAGGDEATSPVVSGPSLPPHSVRDVPGVLGGPFRGRSAWLFRERELPLLLFGDEQLERAFEERLEITGWVAMPAQVLRFLHEIANALTGGEADLVSICAELHDRRSFGRRLVLRKQWQRTV
jgi:hypothetical protein